MDEFFERMPITEITATKIQEYIAHRRNQAPKPSDATIRRELNGLRSALGVAKGLDLVTDNHIPTFKLPQDSAPRECFMEVKDFEKFLAAFHHNIQPTIIFLYYSGSRSGAAEEIAWSRHRPLRDYS